MPADRPQPPDLIVFSHGNSFPGATYGVMLNALRARGFTVAAVDKFGHDPRFPVTNNWPHLVGQLHEFTQREVDAAGTKAWLVGHSLGGYLSLMCAALYPDVTRGVVLMDSPIVTGWRANALHVAKRTQLVGSVSPGARSRKRRESWPSRDAALEHFRHKKLFSGWQPKVLEDYIDHGTMDDERGQRVLSFDRDIETAIYNTLPHNLESLLKRHPLKMPLTFIGGTRSAEIRQAGLATTHRVAHGRITMLEGTHHYPMEKPDVAAAAVELAVMEMRGVGGRAG